MKAIILARVSTEEQRSEGHSIPAQIKKAREYCQRVKLEIQSEHAFDESSLKDKRTKFDEVINDVEQSEIEIALVVETIDRLQRSFKESVLLEDFRRQGKLKIHFIRENLVIDKESNSADLLRWDMGVMFARSYVLQISDNVKRSQVLKIQNGEFPGPAPFGYVNTKDQNDNPNIEPHPLKSKIVQKIFEWYSSGAYSMDSIRAKIEELWKIRIYKSRINTILKNPFYYGEMRFSGTVAPHRYQTLISKESFDRAQALKAGYHKKPAKTKGLPFLYRSVIRCKECGCSITPERHTKKSGKTYFHYRCTQYYGKHQAKSVQEHELTKQFEEYFQQIQIPEEVVKSVQETLKSCHEGKKNYHSQMKAHFEAEYNRLETRIEKMYDEKLDGCITEDEYNKRLTRYRIEQKDLQNKLNNLHTADEDYYTTAEYLLKLSNRIPEIFKSSKPEVKRRLIKLVLSNPVLDDVNLYATIRKPFSRWAKGSSCSKWRG